VKTPCLSLFLGASLALTFPVEAQVRPYIGYVYPAGGQQGATFEVRLGGQSLDEVSGAMVTGSGVNVRIVEVLRRLNNQEVQLLNEQLRELRRAPSRQVAVGTMTSSMESAMAMSSPAAAVTSEGGAATGLAATADRMDRTRLLARIEKRVREYVQTPACASIASLVVAEVTIASNAPLGAREIRLTTPRGVSNPLVFQVGQLPETTRKPMLTATLQVLGKEAQALRKRPPEEAEVRITPPCTANGQIASGEINRYRFKARKGQRLVMAVQARELIPFIADAVPGWFQPVLTLYDDQGKEAAFSDDYRFKPDPVILFEVPKDGEYVLAITDAIYRGREDFVYRLTVGELPFVTSIFPLGSRRGATVKPLMQGWNLDGAHWETRETDDAKALQWLVADRNGLVSNPVPFASDDLAETAEREPNNTLTNAQRITLPVVINGRVDRPDDRDVFEFQGPSNRTVVVEVLARRLDSPLDSVVRVTDAAGNVLAVNDDHEDLAAGYNTHHADSWLMARLPSQGKFFVHVADTARKGGPDYGYRLRVSAPRPDFELRVTPSSLALRRNSTTTITVYAQRKDGFTGPIRLSLEDPPPGFSAPPVVLAANQTMTRLTVRGPNAATPEPVRLDVIGSAKVGERELIRRAVPAEDRMQAFLWRHLVPARELVALVFDASSSPPARRVPPALPPAMTNAVAGAANAAGTNTVAASRPKFTKQQVNNRLRQLRLLYEEGLLTDEFYLAKVAECAAAQ